MKHTFKSLPGSKIELEVKLTDEEFKKYYQPLFDEAAAKVQIKGFRPGAAPKEMLAQGVDHEKVFRLAIQDAVRFSLNEVKMEHDWSLIDQPSVEVKDSTDGVSYTATLTIFPEVKLGSYQKLAKKVFGTRREITVTDDEKQKTVDWLLNSRAASIRVARPAQLKDLVEIDLETTSEGKPVPNSSFKGERFLVGESHFMKGFDDQLVGKSEGAEFEFSITAPADYWQKDLQNKKIDFKVKLHGVYEQKKPEFDDAFAATLGTQFKTVADVHKSIGEGLLMEKQEKETERLRLEALAAIVADSKMEIPEVLVERTLDNMVSQTKGMVPPDASKDEAALDKELREKLRERAKENVASHLILYALAKAEKLEPTAEEIEAEAKVTGVDLEQYHDYIYDRLQNQKVFKFLESQTNNA